MCDSYDQKSIAMLYLIVNILYINISVFVCDKNRDQPFLKILQKQNYTIL